MMMRPLARCSKRVFHAVTHRAIPARQVSSLLHKFDLSVEAMPMREAVRYEENNLKWTASQFNQYVEAHANAMLEHGMKPGDAVAVWLPEKAEKHVVFMAAAKAGFRVVEVDLALTAVSEVRDFLKLANCKAIYFQAQHGDTDYLTLLRKSIPEFFHYDDSAGQFFHSKYYPSMRFFIHMGLENEVGALNFKELFLRDPPKSHVQQVSAALSDSSALHTSITKGAQGVLASSILTHGQALDAPSWAFAKKMVDKEYFEVPSSVAV